MISKYGNWLFPVFVSNIRVHTTREENFLLRTTKDDGDVCPTTVPFPFSDKHDVGSHKIVQGTVLRTGEG